MFLADLLILLVFVWLSRKLFQFMKLPALFGEVFAGVIAGPLILGFVQETEAIKVLAELGIFFLMFHSGLESDPKDLFKASKNAVFVAIGSAVFSILAGFFVALQFGYDVETSVFLGLVMSITAVAISVRLFKDLKINGSKVAHTVMAAAVMTEVFVLVAFSIFLDIAETGVWNPQTIVIDLFKFAVYFAVVFYVGHHYFRY
ncbi:cation:proton antiporter, partial [Candidatus Gracilibacteria bacterium]|nr:cation:proton antiporter [Candidatus Gracilibacteria bacterium]